MTKPLTKIILISQNSPTTYLQQ